MTDDVIERCETCRFGVNCPATYYRDAPKMLNDPPSVTCRRYPPWPGGARYGASDALRKNFPKMRLDDWCGEYQPLTADQPGDRK